MQYMSATEASASFSTIIDNVAHQPIAIQRENKEVAVIISPEDYKKLHQLKLKELDELCERVSAYAEAQGMTEEKLAELLASDD